MVLTVKCLLIGRQTMPIAHFHSFLASHPSSAATVVVVHFKAVYNPLHFATMHINFVQCLLYFWELIGLDKEWLQYKNMYDDGDGVGHDRWVELGWMADNAHFNSFSRLWNWLGLTRSDRSTVPPGSYNSQEISTWPVMRMRISSFKDDEDCEDNDN